VLRPGRYSPHSAYWAILCIFAEMISDEIRQKLQNIIRGNVLEGQKDYCTAIRNLLCQSFGSDPTSKKEFESRAIVKEEQARFLKAYAEERDLWMQSLPIGCQYLTQGGESEIHLAPDQLHVIKNNDAVYYATWLEYFNSLLIHNLLFPNTTYNLMGFKSGKDGELRLVIQQQFIEGEQAELTDIRDHLGFNGFEHTKRQDYFNSEFGLILEDMHDENVIARNDVLFFIDTVFYIVKGK
jgi:serine/threonin/tyrosin kinase-like protein